MAIDKKDLEPLKNIVELKDMAWDGDGYRFLRERLFQLWAVCKRAIEKSPQYAWRYVPPGTRDNRQPPAFFQNVAGKTNELNFEKIYL